MDNCYISIGLIDYNPGLAWTATLIVFCTGIVIGFITEIDKKVLLLLRYLRLPLHLYAC